MPRFILDSLNYLQLIQLILYLPFLRTPVNLVLFSFYHSNDPIKSPYMPICNDQYQFAYISLSAKEMSYF